MRNIKTVAPLLLPLVVAACQTPEPVRLASSIQTSPLLAEVSPSDIAVLPIEDATPERAFQPYAETLRKEIAKSLVHKLYSPLSMRLVDAQLARTRGPELTDSVVEASFLVDVAGEFKEDALLGVRVVRWNDSGIMNTGRIVIGGNSRTRANRRDTYARLPGDFPTAASDCGWCGG